MSPGNDNLSLDNVRLREKVNVICVCMLVYVCVCLLHEMIYFVYDLGLAGVSAFSAGSTHSAHSRHQMSALDNTKQASCRSEIIFIPAGDKGSSE